jgi:hypothetical protein
LLLSGYCDLAVAPNSLLGFGGWLRHWPLGTRADRLLLREYVGYSIRTTLTAQSAVRFPEAI